MKKIGFVDYYISEWHANNYPAWIKQANERLGTDYGVTYAWAEEDISPVSGESTDGWCERMGVARCASIAELCEKSDGIIVLAPSNPEKHLQYAKETLPFAKHTYIDKTFAPDFETAKEIYRIAGEYRTPFFSTSALRFADELKAFEGANNLMITGGGGNFPEYMIHTVEIAVKLLDNPVKRVKTEKVGKQRICRAVTENGKEAAVIYSPSAGFSVSAEPENGEYAHFEINSEYFVNLITEIIKFFETGVLPFDAKQTLEAMRLRTALLDAEKTPEKWIEINGDETI